MKYANKLKKKYKNRFKFFQKKFSEIDGMLSKPNNSKKKKIDKATKSFQAIRMFINDEITELNKGLIASEKFLTYGGILCVVSFHSKEDSIVKNFLNECQRKSKLVISKFLPPNEN